MCRALIDHDLQIRWREVKVIVWFLVLSLQASNAKQEGAAGGLGPWGYLCLGFESSSPQPRFSLSNSVLHGQFMWCLQDIYPATACVTI